MIPVDQTSFREPDGDCFTACLASILECEVDDLHAFREDYRRAAVDTMEGRRPSIDWYASLVDALLPHGRVPAFFEVFSSAQMPLDYCIGVGRSAHGRHACVYLNGEMVHDPHPGRDGLQSIDGYYLVLEAAR